MKKTKNILKENIKKQLITESVKVDLVTTIGTFFTKKGAKITTTLTDLLDDLKKIPVSDAAQYGSKLSELLKALPDDLFDELADEIITLNKSSYDAVLNYSLKNGGTDFLQKASSKSMSTKEMFQKYFENSFSKKGLDSDVSKELGEKFAKKLDDEFSIKSSSTSTSGLGKPTSGLKKSLDNIFQGNFQTWIRIWTRGFKKPQMLQKKFNSLFEKAVTELAAGRSANELIKEMGDTLLATKKSWDEMPLLTYRKWRDELLRNPPTGVDPKDIQKVINQIESAGSKDSYHEVFQYVKNQNPSTMTRISAESKAFREAWPFRLPYSKNSNKGFLIFSSNIDKWKRFARVLTYGDPRTAKELVEAFTNAGIKGGITSFIVGRFITHYVVIPMTYSFIVTTLQATVSWSDDIIEGITGKELSWEEWIGYERTGEGGWENLKTNFLSNISDIIPGWNFLNPLEHTYIDNIVKQVLNVGDKIYEGGLKGQEAIQELTEKTEELKEKALEEINNAKENLDEKKQKVVDEVEEKMENNEPITSDYGNETADLSTLSVGKPINTEGAKKLGLSSQYSRYGKWANLVYVSPEEIKLVWNRDNPKVADEVEFPNKIIKKIEGEWYFTSKGIYRQGLFEKTIIRKKLIEYKKMKTIKESLKSKLQKKSKKVDVISENLYKVAGKFYNENYNEFFKKFEKLTENYKKSKLFLKEDSSESFNRALNKVFKGDESKLKNEAIPYFLNKLGLEGKIREKVKNELNAKYDDNNVGDLFLDCWADIVVQAFKDNAKSEISEPSNVMDAIEKIMVSKIDSPEFDYQLKKEICKMLKPAQEERQTKVQDLAKKLAQSIIDSSEA